MATKYHSSSNDRKTQIFQRPREYMMFEAERDMMLRGESEHGKEIISAHYRAMTPTHQQQLITHYQEKLADKVKVKK